VAGRCVRAFLHTPWCRKAAECSARPQERPSARVASGCSPRRGPPGPSARMMRPPTPAQCRQVRGANTGRGPEAVVDAGRGRRVYPRRSQGRGRYRNWRAPTHTRERRARRGRGWWRRGAGSQGHWQGLEPRLRMTRSEPSCGVQQVGRLVEQQGDLEVTAGRCRSLASWAKWSNPQRGPCRDRQAAGDRQGEHVSLPR
jgi:hypothetical protein